MDKPNNMKYLIILSGVAVVIAGVLLYVVLGGDQAPVDTTADSNETSVPEVVTEESTPLEPFSGSGTLASLVGRGQSLECTIVYESPNAPTVEGTYFVNDGRVRGDFLSKVPELGGDVLSSIIMADGEFYSWSEIGGQLYGVKTTATGAPGATEGTSAARPPVPDDATVTYDCRPWTQLDNSIFEPPSTVLFQDMSNLMDASMEFGTIYTEGETLPE